MEGENRENNFLPHPELNPRSRIRSPHFASTISEVRRKSPEIAGDVRRVLESIDKQGIENLGFFESDDYPGLRIPYTKVNVNEVAGENFPSLNSKNESKEQQRKIVYFLFRGFALPPDGHPFTAWNMVYDRTITSFAKIASAIKRGETPPEVEIHSLGSPVGMGGKVSEGWLEAMKSEGYDAHGKAYAGLVRSLLEDGDQSANRTVVFNGNSMGSTVAEKTSGILKPLGYEIKLLLDNPVNTDSYAQPFKYARGIQQAVAYLGESGIRLLRNKRAIKEGKEVKKFNLALEEIIKEKFNDVEDENQKKLKRSALFVEEGAIIKGSTLDREARTFVRRGFKDTLTFKPGDFLRGAKRSKGLTSLGQKGRVSTYAIDSAHFIDRVRVKQWKRAIDYCKRG